MLDRHPRRHAHVVGDEEEEEGDEAGLNSRQKVVDPWSTLKRKTEAEVIVDVRSPGQDGRRI